MSASPTHEKAPGKGQLTTGHFSEHGQATSPPPPSQAPISTFPRVTDKAPVGQTTVADFMRGIREGEHAAIVTAAREATARGDKPAADAIKKSLPAVTLSGLVTGDRAKAFDQGRFQHSGWIQADLDKKDLGGADPATVRDSLVKDRHVQAAFITPSGEGVKAIVRVPRCESPDEHRRAFESVKSHLLQCHGLKIDPSTKDPARLCFASYDPAAAWNVSSVTPLPYLPEKALQVSAPLMMKIANPPAFTGNAGTSLAQLPEILRFIAPRPNYEEWLRICSGAWNEFGEAATPHLAAWSPEEKPGEYAAKFPHRLADVGIGTLVMLAKERGYRQPEGARAAEHQEPGGEMPQPERDKSPTPGQRAAFAFVRADQLGGVSEAFDFVEGLLTDGGASVIYGPSNCGKSFWVVDLGVAVASGTPFRDELAVEQGAVVYIALEGAHGARNRIEALKQAGILKPNASFYLIFESVSLLEAGHAVRLAETVSQIAAHAGVRVKLVILDTMARAMAGGDENSGQDMTAAVSSIDAVRAATGAHVAVVHHCGKDEARGARGHSSLRAAVDTEIEVSRPDGQPISTVRVTKQRDLQAGEAMPFSLKVVELGTDRRGKPITSCIVQHEDAMMASKPAKSGRPPICTADDMLVFLPAASAKDWQDRVREELGLGETQFYAHKKVLTEQGKIQRERGSRRILAAQEMTLPL